MYRSAPSDDDMSPISPVVPYRSPGNARDPPAGVLKGDILPSDDPHETAPGGISTDQISDWATQVERNPMYSLAQTVFSKSNMNELMIPREADVADNMVFNVQIKTEANPVANQLASGRCWLFASTNVMRIYVARKYNIEEFQLSQSYLYFYDHLNKANWFLEQIIDLAGDPLDSQTNQFLFKDTESQDGGAWDMACALIAKYGLVPQTVYPESFNSSNSEKLDGFLSSKLRENAIALRDEYKRVYRSQLQKKGPQNAKDQAIRSARSMKETQMEVIFRILAIALGTPPQPNEKFVWEFRNKDKKFTKIVSTPLDFVRDCCSDYDPQQAISLINDPRNTYNEIYTVERLGNVVGGRPIRYVNVEIDTLKQAAITALKQDMPVWFGCDVEKAASFSKGLLDTKVAKYGDAFGAALTMSKEDRLRSGDSSMTHAMIFTAVHLDDKGNPFRWKVENSWGPDRCKKGYFVMTDDWFSEYVFQVVAQRRLVSPKLVRKYENPRADVTSLPPWDALGALA